MARYGVKVLQLEPNSTLSNASVQGTEELTLVSVQVSFLPAYESKLYQLKGITSHSPAYTSPGHFRVFLQIWLYYCKDHRGHECPEKLSVV